MLTSKNSSADSVHEHEHEHEQVLAKQQVVRSVFGTPNMPFNPQAELPSMEKMLVLLWLYKNDADVIDYLVKIMETHVMDDPKCIDAMESYAAPLAQLAFLKSEQHTTERILLIMAQLSTRFAIEYYWALQTLLQHHQPQYNPAVFDLNKYTRCVTMINNLERCMKGQLPEKQQQCSNNDDRTDEASPIHIIALHGGKVTTDESHSITESTQSQSSKRVKDESNQDFFATVLELANNNVTTTESTVHELPMKNSFGGVLLLCKLQERKRVMGRTLKWKPRYFAIEQGMLHCYRQDKTIERTMRLEGATLWKGPQQDKYPHSFIVQSDTSDTFFFLQAKTAEEKSLWKRALRQYVTEPSKKATATELTQAQTERLKKYQQSKWFGRTMINMARDLSEVPQNERSDFLYETCFDLDIPATSHVLWPWRDTESIISNNSKSVEEKHVFVVLPHFSRPLGEASSFRASFILNSEDEKKSYNENENDSNGENDSNKNENAIKSGSYLNFIRQGRLNTEFKRLEIPKAILDERLLQPTRAGKKTFKTLDDESITGESSADDGLSDESGDSDDSSNEFMGSYENTLSNKAMILDEELSRHDDLSTCFTKQDKEVVLDFDDDVSIAPSINFSIELVVAGLTEIPTKKKKITTPSKSETKNTTLLSSKDKVGENNATNNGTCLLSQETTFKVLPKTTKGLVSVSVQAYVHEEMLALQMTKYYQKVLQDCNVWLYTPRVQRVSTDMVIFELPKNATSIADAKRLHGGRLIQYFVKTFGDIGSESYQMAQACFARSLAGMSLLTYVLGIRNRHDTNIMIDSNGHVFLANLSCALGNGKSSIKMESHPFKLTKEYETILGGSDSEYYQQFTGLFVSGLEMINKDAPTAIAFATLISTALANGNKKSCSKAVQYLRSKVLLSGASNEVLRKKAISLIQKSKQNFTMSAALHFVSKSNIQVGVEV